MHNDALRNEKNDARSFCEKLSAYLDGDLPEDLCREIVEHVRNCKEPCRGVHDDVVKLAECCREQRRKLDRVPAEFHESLMKLIMAEVRKA